MASHEPFSILVTRPVHQADNMVSLIERQGWRAIRFPALEIVPAQLTARSVEILENIEVYDGLIFVSANAANFALQANNGKINAFKKCPIAAVGKATAKALESLGLTVDWVPEAGFDSEALLAMPQFQHIAEQAFLIVRGEGGREKLAETLRERGARVDYLEVYKRVKPQADVEQIADILKNGRLHVVTITSGEALLNLIELLGTGMLPFLLSVPLVVISERTKRMAEHLGFTTIAIASGPDDEAVINQIQLIKSEEDRGRID
ncbi:MAG: uroporphyrinogen-III synthase [Methylomicrobium sp.]